MRSAGTGPADAAPLAREAARTALVRAWRDGLAPTLRGLIASADQLAASPQPAPELRLRRQRAAADLAACRDTLAGLLGRALADDAGDSEALPLLQLVEDARGDREILASRLARALSEAAGEAGLRWRQALRARDLGDTLASDPTQPQPLARQLLERWQRADLDLGHWRTLQALLHGQFGRLYRQALAAGLAALDPLADASPAAADPGAAAPADVEPDPERPLPPQTRLKPPPRRLPASPALHAAIAEAQRETLLPVGEAWTLPGAPLFDSLHSRTLALKAVADHPDQRATIEGVALMFQHLLAEARLPIGVRLGLARLQLPVLRIALEEPDIFAEAQHPARRLIDRLGACALGFEPGPQAADPALEAELLRIVQLVEAYPDSGRRVFEAALAEFEGFVTRRMRLPPAGGPSALPLVQQMEEREARLIQATVTLRRELAGERPPPALRDFLFHVWAEVLAARAMQAKRSLVATAAPAGDETSIVAELLWLCHPKRDREERAEALRRLAPLMLRLRAGMREAGLAPHRQEEQLRSLQGLLHAAFSACEPDVDPGLRLAGLGRRLDALEGLSPDPDRLAQDALLAIEQTEADEAPRLQLIRSGGLPPSAATLARVAELAVGSWFRWQPAGAPRELLQLAWLGRRRRLALLLARDGRAWLFPLPRLAAHLQAGSLEAAQAEPLSAQALRAIRDRPKADPQEPR